MKKLLTLIVCALVVWATSTAQNVGGGRSSGGNTFFSTEKVDKSVIIGIRGGMNIAGLSSEFVKSYGKDHSFKNAVGFNVGVNVDIPIVQSFYVQTGAYFTSKNAKIEETVYDDGVHFVKDIKLNPMYVEIPLLASYRYNFNEKAQLQVNLGPYFAYGVTGKANDGEERINLFSKTKNISDEKFLKPFDAGICIGLGFTLNHFFVGVKYEKGFTNICNPKGWQQKYWQPGYYNEVVYIQGLKGIKTHNFSINVGYDF